ncbi:hypothetical protein HOK021_02310 [Streptomyces hygroscopicus]|nr:hypothetical protein HOK021_02310 [Streptomyces hygroscopicus]
MLAGEFTPPYDRYVHTELLPISLQDGAVEALVVPSHLRIDCRSSVEGTDQHRLTVRTLATCDMGCGEHEARRDDGS